MEKENRTLEYKESVSKSYLKTVSAFSNYNDGIIIFGVSDDYCVVGISDPIQECLNIENQINDSIRPKPDYSLKINDDKTITLFVKKGLKTPYRYNGKCYKRNDSATIEADSIAENRLVLEGMNKKFEELKSKDRSLTFKYLENDIVNRLGLKRFDTDILISLNLYSKKDGYNNAAALLADKNDFPGIDIVVFGNNFNEFKRRYSLNGFSLLRQFKEALDVFKDEYIVERIEDGYRKRVELVPMDAYREAVANAIIHRTYDVAANTKIEMYPDKIIISSPGGLLPEISREDFLRGSYSYLRNPIIANVFHRLNIVEIFATGIRRINQSYNDCIMKPTFDLTSSSVSVSLPITSHITLSKNEAKVLSKMNSNYQYTRPELEELTSINKDTMLRVIKSLLDKEVIEKIGKAKSTRYMKK